MYQGPVPVISNHEVMPGVYLMWLDAPEIAASVRPGQFVMVNCDSGQDRLLRRPLSIHRARPQSLAVLFAAVGAGTDWLSRRPAEEKIDLLGPLGNGFSLQPHARRLLLVAGGMGIAPLAFLAQEALKKDYSVKLLAGARTASHIIPEQLVPEGTDVIRATEDGSIGEAGMVTDLIPRYAESADQVCLCGPLPMFKAVANKYHSYLAGKTVQASLEVRMGCGLGFCYACTIRTGQGLKQVCKDGPVFDFNEIIWEELSS
jgi:dihydroorotate dehydrogenase electron transfer subunit